MDNQESGRRCTETTVVYFKPFPQVIDGTSEQSQDSRYPGLLPHSVTSPLPPK
jgi:hypothetical protein